MFTVSSEKEVCPMLRSVLHLGGIRTPEKETWQFELVGQFAEPGD